MRLSRRPSRDRGHGTPPTATSSTTTRVPAAGTRRCSCSPPRPALGTLPLSGSIDLSTPVNDIQGCDFVTATQLICASDDDSETLFANPFPLLEVTLAATGTLRVEITQPGVCEVATTVYEYQQG
ncbi:MAG: hypothetical protein ACRDN0_35180 [Trebonia sp.]